MENSVVCGPVVGFIAWLDLFGEGDIVQVHLSGDQLFSDLLSFAGS